MVWSVHRLLICTVPLRKLENNYGLVTLVESMWHSVLALHCNFLPQADRVQLREANANLHIGFFSRHNFVMKLL